MELDTARDFLANVVKEFPFPENEYEAGYLRKHMQRYRDSCDLIAANCPPEGNLLSIGCEPGHIEILLKEFFGFRQIIGLSYRASQEFKLRMAKFDIPILECDVENESIPNEHGQFHSVVFLEVLEHMFTGVPHALSEMHRVLLPGGIMILSTPNLAQFRNRIKLLKGGSINWPLDGSKNFFGKQVHLRHNREYTAKEICFLLHDAGFEIGKIRYGEYSPMRPRFIRMFNSLYPTFKSTIFIVSRRK